MMGLFEIFHPSITQLKSISGQPHASKLDRFYSSHSKAEREVMKPRIWLRTRMNQGNNVKGAPNDHFPLNLSFYPTGWRSKKQHRISKLSAASPELADAVKERWDVHASFDNPCEELRALKSLIVKCDKDLRKSRKFSTTSYVDAVTLAMSVYREILAGGLNQHDAHDKCQKNEVLRKRLGDENSITKNLESFLSKYSGIEVSEEPELPYVKKSTAFGGNVELSMPRVKIKTMTDYNRNIKEACEPRSGGLDFLVDDKGD